MFTVSSRSSNGHTSTTPILGTTEENKLRCGKMRCVSEVNAFGAVDVKSNCLRGVHWSMSIDAQVPTLTMHFHYLLI